MQLLLYLSWHCKKITATSPWLKPNNQCMKDQLWYMEDKNSPKSNNAFNLKKKIDMHV